MRLDGFNPFNALPERGTRPVPPPASESARVDQAGAATAVSIVRLPAARPVNAITPSAEYIPARREAQEPVYGRANQALASYQATANLPADYEADGIFGIDLYA
ncbi:MAG TPA: hypothetical protein ENI17_03310 [Pseudomonas xinjiangensis]|uniref:Uncharacterized protein n=2 Tax=root TaxID=1 RepID=A0A7V1BMT0_9GAMM|nr:hypothetical protein [Halopseudomonas xinjiangensis]HEC46638.1 hypothetical protein [Halopseudomonas xinjiangensis]